MRHLPIIFHTCNTLQAMVAQAAIAIRKLYLIQTMSILRYDPGDIVLSIRSQPRARTVGDSIG